VKTLSIATAIAALLISVAAARAGEPVPGPGAHASSKAIVKSKSNITNNRAGKATTPRDAASGQAAGKRRPAPN
jgi:hypothetical protein